MAGTTLSQKKQKIEQRIHREELKLAHLKTKVNKAKLADTRLKQRLGELLFTMNWQEFDSRKLSDRIKHVRATMLDPSTHEDFKIQGENTLHRLEMDKVYKPSPSRLSQDQITKFNLLKISLGDLLIKHELHNYPRATVFGALLEFNRRLHNRKPMSDK